VNGLINLRARSYNPTIGQFMSLDLLEGITGQPTSLNRYTYVQDNPINMVDPSGLKACPVSDDVVELALQTAYAGKIIQFSDIQKLRAPVKAAACIIGEGVDFAVTHEEEIGAGATITAYLATAAVASGVGIATLIAGATGIAAFGLLFYLVAQIPPHVYSPFELASMPVPLAPPSNYGPSLDPTASAPKQQPTAVAAPSPSDNCSGDERRFAKKDVALGFNSIGSNDNALRDFAVNINTILNQSGIKAHPYGGLVARNPLTGRPLIVEDWQIAGLSDAYPTIGRSGNFDQAFAQATQRAGAIHFNLEGIPGKYVDFINTAPSSNKFVDATYSQITANELALIRKNAALCRKTIFYKYGTQFPPVPSPDANSEICSL